MLLKNIEDIFLVGLGRNEDNVKDKVVCTLQIYQIKICRILTYLNIQEFLCKHWRSMINRITRSIECSTKHFNAHWHSEYITGELASGRDVIDT